MADRHRELYTTEETQALRGRFYAKVGVIETWGKSFCRRPGAAFCIDETLPLKSGEHRVLDGVANLTSKRPGPRDECLLIGVRAGPLREGTHTMDRKLSCPDASPRKSSFSNALNDPAFLAALRQISELNNSAHRAMWSRLGLVFEQVSSAGGLVVPPDLQEMVAQSLLQTFERLKLLGFVGDDVTPECLFEEDFLVALGWAHGVPRAEILQTGLGPIIELVEMQARRRADPQSSTPPAVGSKSQKNQRLPKAAPPPELVREFLISRLMSYHQPEIGSAINAERPLMAKDLAAEVQCHKARISEVFDELFPAGTAKTGYKRYQILCRSSQRLANALLQIADETPTAAGSDVIAGVSSGRLEDLECTRSRSKVRGSEF